MTGRLLVRAALTGVVTLLFVGCGASGESMPSGRSGKATDLLFVRSRQGAYAIYVMAANGSGQTHVDAGLRGRGLFAGAPLLPSRPGVVS